MQVTKGNMPLQVQNLNHKGDVVMCMMQSFLSDRGKNVPACMGVSALGGYEDPDEDKRETPRLLVLSAQRKTTYVRYFPHMFFRWIYALIRLEILLLLCVRTNIVVI